MGSCPEIRAPTRRTPCQMKCPFSQVFPPATTLIRSAHITEPPRRSTTHLSSVPDCSTSGSPWLLPTMRGEAGMLCKEAFRISGQKLRKAASVKVSDRLDRLVEEIPGKTAQEERPLPCLPVAVAPERTHEPGACPPPGGPFRRPRPFPDTDREDAAGPTSTARP